MKIYKIRLNVCTWDQYSGFVLRAENEKEVVKMLKEKYPEEDILDEVDWKEGFVIEEIEENGKEEIILSDFNAG